MDKGKNGKPQKEKSEGKGNLNEKGKRKVKWILTPHPTHYKSVIRFTQCLKTESHYVLQPQSKKGLYSRCPRYFKWT